MIKKVVTVSLLMLTLLGAACSRTLPVSEPGSTPSDGADIYMSTLCTSLGTWLGSVSRPPEGQGSSSTLEEEKGEILAFLETMIAGTEVLIEDLRAAGIPDVESGEEMHSAMLTSLDSAHASMEGVVQQAQSLSTENAAMFKSQREAIDQQMQDVTSQISAALGGISSPELDQAAAQSEACTALISASSTVPSS